MSEQPTSKIEVQKLERFWCNGESMIPRDFGEWVRHDDVQELIERLQRELAGFKPMTQEELREHARAASETTPDPVVTLSGYALRAAIEFLAPDNTAEQFESELSIQWDDNGHSGKGYYACFSEYPEEGSILLPNGAEEDDEGRESIAPGDYRYYQPQGAAEKSTPVHADPTGTTREPPHCPTCSCETCAHQHPDRQPTDTYCRDCGQPLKSTVAHQPTCASYRVLPRGECDCGAVKTTPVHADPTGTTREPPHCPTCSCRTEQQALDEMVRASEDAGLYEDKPQLRERSVTRIDGVGELE